MTTMHVVHVLLSGESCSTSHDNNTCSTCTCITNIT